MKKKLKMNNAMNETTLLKTCTKCRQRQTLDNFHADKSRRDGFCDICKRCKAKRDKKYRKENHVLVTKGQRRSYHKNRKKNLKRMRIYHGSIKGCLHQFFNDIKKRIANPIGRNRCYQNVENKFKDFNDFEDYIVNDLKVDPRGKYLQRIDTSKHYSKGNLKFVPIKPRKVK